MVCATDGRTEGRTDSKSDIQRGGGAHIKIVSTIFVSSNTRIYNLSSGPHITRFSVAVAKKRKNFE